MSKKILSVVIALAVVFAMFIPMTASAAIVNPVADAADFNKVVDGWYISADGGFKMDVGTWSYYGSYGLTLVENPMAYPTNACAVAIYPSTSSRYDAPEVFENKTKENFESVLSETVDVFEKKTVGNAEYTMYYAKTATYENYVFQTENAKYFINFIYGVGDRDDYADFAAAAIASIVLADDPEPCYVIYKVDGAEVARDKYFPGDTIVPREEPSKDGFEFSGWSEIPAVMGEEDVVVEGTFAKLSPTIFEVIYYVDGEEYARETYEVGDEIIAKDAPTKEGFEFSGWSEIPEVMPEEDVIVNGTFTAIPPSTFDVIYYVDGEEFARETYEVGATITAIDAPTKEGFTFSGWSEIPEVMPEEDVIVNGTFTENAPEEIPETGDNTALIAVGAIAALAFVALIATKKRALSK